MTTEPLPLDGLVIPEPTADALAGLSADRRRTLRRQQALAAGVHPATGLTLLPTDLALTCGDCVFFARLDWHGRTYLKCTKAGVTHGAATDVRRSWPACRDFRPHTKEPS